LIKHFNLLMTHRQIGREVFEISSRIVALQSAGRTDAGRHEIDQLCARLGDARNRQADVFKQAGELRRETLTLGVRFMDLNMSGAVEPEDRPQISAELFSRLDVARKHRFTAADVQSAVSSMEKNILRLDNHLIDLNKDLNKLYHDQNNIKETNAEKFRLRHDKIQTELNNRRAEITKTTTERNREDMFLRETFAFFQECFTQALFTNLGYGRHKISEQFQGSIRADVAGVQRDLTLSHVSEGSGARALGAEAPSDSSFSKGASTLVQPSSTLDQTGLQEPKVTWSGQRQTSFPAGPV